MSNEVAAKPPHKIADNMGIHPYSSLDSNIVDLAWARCVGGV